MIKRLKLTDFRGFKKIVVGPFERVNLIVGRNNVGKSSILEALFLLNGPTNPELPLRLSALRGIERFRNDADEMWGWLFHKKQTERSIELVADMKGGKSRELSLKLAESKGMQLSHRRNRKVQTRALVTASTADQPSRLEMRYKDEKGGIYVTSALLRDTLEFQRDRPLRLPMCIFITGRSGYTEEDPERFSKLEEVGREQMLVTPLRELEPRLIRLAVLVTGSGPVIHGDIGMGHMIPAHFMGGGIGRLMSILLAIASCPKGVVLIDEVETGLHYSAMVATWRAISEAAKQHEVQVIATTHNWECLKAAHEVFSEEEDPNFAVYRIDHHGDEAEAVEYTSDMLETALMTGLEIR